MRQFLLRVSLEPIAKEVMPEVSIMYAGDDTVQRDNLAAPVGTIPKVSFYKFVTFARFFEDAGIGLIVPACSTFNQAVEFARPMMEKRWPEIPCRFTLRPAWLFNRPGLCWSKCD